MVLLASAEVPSFGAGNVFILVGYLSRGDATACPCDAREERQNDRHNDAVAAKREERWERRGQQAPRRWERANMRMVGSRRKLREFSSAWSSNGKLRVWLYRMAGSSRSSRSSGSKRRRPLRLWTWTERSRPDTGAGAGAGADADGSRGCRNSSGDQIDGSRVRQVR